jgi:hypothetical protein
MAKAEESRRKEVKKAGGEREREREREREIDSSSPMCRTCRGLIQVQAQLAYFIYN